jgi:Na+/H+ antiporter NhaD/arsenite permease-like protein
MMSDGTAEAVALGIFIFTYALISFNRRGKSRVELPAAALIGGALMLVFGIVSPSAALAGINWNTIVLILGMMLIAAAMEATGFFVWIASIVSRSRSPARLLIVVCTVTALLSALILNDAVVLIFSPVVILTARRMNVTPVPYLIMEAMSANIGSAATEVGNPQNAYIASVSNVPFHAFTILALPPTVLSLVAAIAIALFVGKVHFSNANFSINSVNDGETVIRRRPIEFMLLLVSAVFAGFYTSSFTHFPIAMIALIGGIVSLVAAPFMSDATNQQILQKVDWGIILFFIGLFILISGVQSSGLLSTIVNYFQQVSGGSAATVGGMTVLAAILSNMTSNVPAVLLLAPVVQSVAPTTRIWLTLALSSTFAGNATIIGAAANVIVARAASKQGIHISLSEFVKYGIPITLVSLLLTVVLLSV